MKEKSNVIKKRDFETYQVLLPFSAAAGKRRKQFLSSELEKLHPCFSDEFAFDSVIKKIGKRGFASEVFVINKKLLAEYERKRRFSGSGFPLEGRGRHFVNEKVKLSCWTLIACFIVACFGIILGIKTGRTVQKDEVTFLRETDDKADENWIEEKELLDVSSGLSESFFQTVKEADGKITFFEWRLEAYTQKINARLEGLYPEAFGNFSQGESVVYEKDLPKMTVFLNSRAVRTSNQNLEKPISVQALRNAIIQNGGVLKEEKTSPYHLEFSCNCRTGKTENTGRLFKELARQISWNGQIVTNLSVSGRSSGKADLELQTALTIEDLPLEGFDLALLAENLTLFTGKEIKQEVMLAENEKPSTDFMKKIGEIKRPDNSTVIFFKDSQGKTQKKIEMRR